MTPEYFLLFETVLMLSPQNKSKCHIINIKNFMFLFQFKGLKLQWKFSENKVARVFYLSY